MCIRKVVSSWIKGLISDQQPELNALSRDHRDVWDIVANASRALQENSLDSIERLIRVPPNTSQYYCEVLTTTQELDKVGRARR